MTIEEEIDRAIGGVLFNVSNFPEKAQSRLWGQDMGPLRGKLAVALTPLLNRVRAEALREFARQASKRNIGTLSYRQQVLQHAESYADRIEQNSEGNET